MKAHRRGRPSKIGYDQIVKAALTIGLRDLTMTRLAEELGVAMSTLYHHVSGIDEVNAAVADRLIEDVNVLVQDSEGQEIQALLLAAGRRLRSMFNAAPGFAEIARSSPRMQGKILAVHEGAVRRIVEMGLDPLQAFLTVRALADYVEAMTARDEVWIADGELSEALESNREAALSAGHTALAEAYGSLDDDYLDTQFEFGLRALVSGLAQALPSAGIVD